MKKIVLAFDSFKGSVGSFEIAKAAEKAIQEELPDCQIIRFPIADGGEGTTEALCSALHAQTVSCRVHDPFMKPIEVSYGIVNNGAMAIIEMASACGLPLIDSNRRNPMKTTTYGVGEMVADALKRGCREAVIYPYLYIPLSPVHNAATHCPTLSLANYLPLFGEHIHRPHPLLQKMDY